MKKSLTLVTANIIAVFATTHVLSLEFASEEDADAYFAAEERAWQKIHENIKEGVTDDIKIKEAILSSFEMGSMPESSIEGAIVNVKKSMNEAGIPQERQIKILDIIVRENLSFINVNINNHDACIMPKTYILDSLKMLESFQNYNLVPLLQECFKSNNDYVRNGAMIRYIHITGEIESLQQLREIINEKKRNVYGYEIYRQLLKVVEKNNNENNNGDTDKIFVFLLDMAQIEENPNSIQQLDNMLCKFLPDYTTSIQRGTAINRFNHLLDDTPISSNNVFLTSEDAIQNRLKIIKASIEKIPIEERKDLSRRFTLKNLENH